MRISSVLILLFVVAPMSADDSPSRTSRVKTAVTNEVKRYVRDAKDLAAAPRHWNARQWAHFGEGVGAVAVLYSADQRLYNDVQRHRGPFTDDFAKTITPFGGRRALDISALLIMGGVAAHNDRLRDAGRDSLEAEILAGGIVTPLLKRAFGRARPVREEGAHSFHPLSSTDQSFPSGHATNAFAFATGIASHYDGWVVPTIVYSIASGVAFSRVNDRAHFPSDVLAGALIGRAVAKGVVARHRHGTRAWSITPSFGNGGAVVHVTW